MRVTLMFTSYPRYWEALEKMHAQWVAVRPVLAVDMAAVPDAVQHAPLTSTCEVIALDGMKPVQRNDWLWRRKQNRALEATRKARATPAKPKRAIVWV